VDDLLEAILLTADESPIQANPKSSAAGTVVEAELDKARGVVATLLVQNGTLRTSDIIVAGTVRGRIRKMFDDRGNVVDEAPPSMPVSVLGLSDVPLPGDIFRTMQTDREAKTLVSARKQAIKDAIAKPVTGLSLDQIFAKFNAGEMRELPLVVKTDLQGSLEPIRTSLEKLSTDDIRVNIIYGETGNITENDVLLASASKAIIIGFAVTADQAGQRLAEKEGVSIRLYDVIYRLTEDVEKALKGMLEPEVKERVIGKAEVRTIFKISRYGKIAGCRVVEGEMRRNAFVRVLRNGKEVFNGELTSLKHEKDDVKEVKEGFECGINLKEFDDFKEGDIIQCYVRELVAVQ